MHRLHSLTNLVAHPSAFSVIVLATLVLVGLACAYLLSRVDLTIVLVIAIFLQLFSGNWGLLGVPIPLDRVALVLALATLILKGPRYVSSRQLVLRPIHLAMLSIAAWAAASGIIAGTITHSLGFFAYLDRLGIVPFLMFSLAPIFFGNQRQRRILLGTLVVMGFYLGFTGCCEGLHIYKLLFPRYIANPDVGIQWGRARGPLLEATGDGFCTFVCAAASFITWRTSPSLRVRRICLVVMPLDVATLFFTLTRSVWIGAFLGIVLSMMLTKQTRRALVPLVLTGALVTGALLAVSPTIRNATIGRTESQSPVWDRENTDLAAVHIIEDYPLSGVGWENFINVSPQYIRQQGDVPISGIGIEIHNVFLSHAAELGVPGLMLWLLAFGGALRRGLLPRRRRSGEGEAEDPELKLWRLAGFAIVICFLSEADLAPFSQALPNTLLWLWLGILATPYTSKLRLPRQATSRERPPLALPQASAEPAPSPA